jgi:hypothetical protein
VSAIAAGGLWGVLETALVVSIVAACALHAVRTLWPAAWRRARIACALPLMRAGSKHWLYRLGRLLAPEPAVIAGASSCGPCRGCEKGAPPTVALGRSGPR